MFANHKLSGTNIGYRGAPIEEDICKRIRESIRMITQRLIETGDAK